MGVLCQTILSSSDHGLFLLNLNTMRSAAFGLMHIHYRSFRETAPHCVSSLVRCDLTGPLDIRIEWNLWPAFRGLPACLSCLGGRSPGAP